jgi:hypothetical protein
MAARATVNDIAHPLIDYHTRKFCARFCHDNHRYYRCTLSQPIGQAGAGSALCEWGNASYGWMLDDLTRPQRLLKYQANNGASLFDYLYRIANSLPFYERWKDWRFGRRVHVPTFIQDISPQAARVFYALREGQNISLIAQQLALSVENVENISRKIINTLTRRHKLYLLDAPQSQSLTTTEDDDQSSAAGQLDVASHDEPFETRDERECLDKAWQQLDAIEQFVLEALVIDELDAKTVLQSLAELDISIKKNVPAAQTSIQQLYYFKRKALLKLEKKR